MVTSKDSIHFAIVGLLITSLFGIPQVLPLLFPIHKFQHRELYNISPNKKIKVLLVRKNPGGDAKVCLVDSLGRNLREIDGISFSDCDEKLKKLSWSPNSSKLAFLVINSNASKWIEDQNKLIKMPRYRYGKWLVIYDVSFFPRKVNKIFENTEDDIQNFELFNTHLIYECPNKKEIFKF